MHLIADPWSNHLYEERLKEMEQSMVKLRIAEKEARLQKMSNSKENIKPLNGTHQKDGKYYLVRLEMEIEKLKSLIDTSEADNRLGQIPEEASGKIRNAVGKAQLLIKKRFSQFRELCQDNIENDPDKKETKPSDLQGYWEMMFIQIDDVSALFKEIETLKANNWLEPKQDHLDGPPKGNGKPVTPKGKRKSAGKSPRAKQSNVDDEKVKKEARSRLAAARKQAKLRQQKLKEEEENNSSSPDNSLNSSLNSSMNFSFDVVSNVNKSSVKNGDKVVDDEASKPNGDVLTKIETNGEESVAMNGFSDETVTKTINETDEIFTKTMNGTDEIVTKTMNGTEEIVTKTMTNGADTEENETTLALGVCSE